MKKKTVNIIQRVLIVLLTVLVGFSFTGSAIAFENVSERNKVISKIFETIKLAVTNDGVLSIIEKTAHCNGITVVLCVNYGGQDEIVRAANRFYEKNTSSVMTVSDLQANLDCPDIPAPDLIARSAGELRLSNFMLWDSAYAEFLCIDTLWPDWGEKEIKFCVDSLSKRTRKFGGLVQ